MHKINDLSLSELVIIAFLHAVLIDIAAQFFGV